MVNTTSQLKMLLLSAWVSMLLGLIAGFLPVVGMDREGGAKSSSDHTPNMDPLSSQSVTNCSQLTLKLEFSTKVVEHGKKLFLLMWFQCVFIRWGNTVFKTSMVSVSKAY